MIKTLLLVLYPGATWDRIVLAKRGWLTISLFFLLPLWVLAGAAEGYGLVHWGKPSGEFSHLRYFSHSQALIFEIIQLVLMVVIVVLCARLIKAVGETFHGRHSFNQAFTVAAYGLGPFFVLRILDIFPSVSSLMYWATWIAAMFLCFGTLYHGIPRVMQPDPPQAFGLYVVSSVLLTIISGLVRFLTFWYLDGNFGKLDMLITKVVEHVPLLQRFDQMHFFK
jgi:hypothetical protein